MDLLKPWGAAILAYLLGAVVNAVLVVKLGTIQEPVTADAALRWVALPALVVFVVMTVAAALCTSARGRRLLLAVLAVPALGVLLTAVFGLADGDDGLVTGLGTAGSAAGTALGLGAVALYYRRRSARESGGYR
ncbi:hypothetical protein [Actinomadura macrotermitis]|uniref:Uncharacterized protein n=1 Tax=Actinomadura macrotermitis TaxID=2585200 RepID=A0A7K0BRP2_9ACTN|nr:hypothetical protein [Actinomadura macrotermitis]MQY03839.1 hypothetical protein [Actinomadura macrotermitis]